MAKLWIGDVRFKQLQQYKNRAEELNLDSFFLVDEDADYYWLQQNVSEQLPTVALDSADVIIMLGLNDCIQCCLCENLNIETIAKKYSNYISNLLKQYKTFSLYICSVPPVDAAYPTALHASGTISLEDINSKIERFNDSLESNLKSSIDKSLVTFVDCYKYFIRTSFTTRDGVHYIGKTCEELQNYILRHLKGSGYAMALGKIKDRIKRDDKGNIETDDKGNIIGIPPDPAEDDYLYWLNEAYGGYNKCIAIQNGSVLPNCTGYAWGRFCEILNADTNLSIDISNPDTDSPELSRANAEYWFGNTEDGYERGTEPRRGAVICWRKGIVGNDPNIEGSDAGHVAIVEAVEDENTIIISQSGWDSKTTVYDKNNKGHFGVKRIHKTADKDNPWPPYGSSSSDYIFQGFIYNPKVSADSTGYVGTVDYIQKSQVESAPNEYFDCINEDKPNEEPGTKMKINGRYIWNYLGAKLPEDERWSLNAVAALLGNIWSESTVNPGLIEKHTNVAWPTTDSHEAIEEYANRYKAAHSKNRFPGYGLTQWTGMSEDFSSDPKSSNYSPFDSWEKHKLVKWCTDRGLDYTDIDSQLQRLLYEVKHPGLQWLQLPKANPDYPISFEEFTKSNKDPGWLACAFVRNYERPGNYEYEERSRRAKAWYNYLIKYTPVSAQIAEATMSIDNLKIDISTPTAIKGSLIVRKGKTGFYKLLGKQYDLDVEPSDDTPKIVKFEKDGLVPNTKYELAVEIAGSIASDKLSDAITFSTPQARPNSVSVIKLLANNKTLPCDSFTLETTSQADVDFGYWKKTGNYGYEIQLIVNGCTIAKEIVNKTLKNFLEFKISEYFKYKVKVGDIIQIGIRTWAEDDSGEKIYDSDFAKCSNPICMLTKPVTAYLNLD